ncbi:hypothetical protein GCM10018785_42200 [Streptomyces longispororuber]|uniref:Uncharacterized protein n=1 Tax=Streptomyces longispororuber TaxID=68230 RepID=A0A918ZUT6_9ACTN|nr:hypothetical protein [Streptomyces longispororuber]GHE69229.1 hypothetical protein GCM10018785_42200 [Streptomyces longispororuber]
MYDVVRDRPKAGEQPHPTQHQDVTEAPLAGRGEPLCEPGRKREHKVQVFPDQFAAWFGTELATSARAAALLFPRIDPAAAPNLVDGDRTVGTSDFTSSATEDRYPDHFGLAHGIDGGGSAMSRSTVTDRLAPSRTTRSSSATTPKPTPTSSANWQTPRAHRSREAGQRSKGTVGHMIHSPSCGR